MKRILTTLLVALTAFSALAQTTNDGTLKFMGVPVDGKRFEMVQQLQKKGFRLDRSNEFLTGKFNGMSVNVFISDNNGKVDRVYVGDTAEVNESQIRIKFNNLISQFENNDKYYTFEDNEPIPEGEDIYYEMHVNKKTYSAQFYYNPVKDNDDLLKEIAQEAQAEVMQDVEDGKVKDPTDETIQSLVAIVAMQKIIKMTSGMVWFTISENYGKYFLSIYYDNLNNRPNGEDL